MEGAAERLMVEDLAKSGLVPDDMNARVMETIERGAVNLSFNTQGYVIPYFDIEGKRQQFYRLRLFDSNIKYIQQKGSTNHLYYPKTFLKTLKASKNGWVFITEGEKKAAAATKAGFPTVGLGGVDSWKTSTLTLPTEKIEHKVKDDKLVIKLPSGFDEADVSTNYAVGFPEFLSLIKKNNLTVFICFDTDQPNGCKDDVQRAAASLGFAFRNYGIALTHIRQLKLPYVHPKMGLDDFLEAYDADELHKYIVKNLQERSTFPMFPNFKEWIQRQLGDPKLSRKKAIEIATMVICHLDANGARMFSDDGQPRFFDKHTKKLTPVAFPTPNDPNYAQHPFAKYLFQQAGISQQDFKVTPWINAMFMSEEPVMHNSTHRIIGRKDTKDDFCLVQLSDSHYARISKEGVQILDNGANGVLGLLKKAYIELKQQPLKNWWEEVLQECRLKDKDKLLRILALLFYISPYLYKWRGTQLPIEMTLGEAGSGKSSLYELRLNIMTGKPKLRNLPRDIRDWNASIANAGGLHVTDNVQLGSRELKQAMSDELCRLVTESNPTIEMRKLYTTADQLQIPIRAVFALTAIQQPFQNSDILQRSIIIAMDKAKALQDQGSLTYDSNWVARMLQKYGGREFWLAHQFLVLEKFFQLVDQKWDYMYRADHRLINFEQSLHLMAEVFGWQTDGWIKEYLHQATTVAVYDADWVFEGLQLYVDAKRLATPKNSPALFTCQDVAEWAQGQSEFEKNDTLTNSRRLSRYIATHKAQIQMMLGVREAGTTNNRQRFQIMRDTEKPS
jgi:hypothetical protein